MAAAYAQAARGLAAAHAAGLVHRDVKPSNLLMGRDGRVRVADFGLARGLATPATDVVGTPAYMAPEQRAGADADARSDQYALCVALAEALGARPVGGRLELDRVGDAPRWLKAIVARGLATEPGARWPDLATLAARLAPPRRWRAVVIGGLAGATAIGLVVGLGLRDGGAPSSTSTERPGCPTPPPIADGLRVVATADNGYALVSRRAGGPWRAEPSVWNDSSSDIFYECEPWVLPADTDELYVVAANAGGPAALYVAADRDGDHARSTSARWQVCDTGVERRVHQRRPDACADAFVASHLATCTWTPVVELDDYLVPAEQACGEVAGPRWIWGPRTQTWLIFRAPPRTSGAAAKPEATPAR
ncbi:MAG: protein kinase [Kofleriaceae bacterium]